MIHEPVQMAFRLPVAEPRHARTEIFQPDVVVGSARFLRTSTFYARHGDIVAYASVVATAALLVVARRRVN